jgi:serine/threonine protein kinase
MTDDNLVGQTLAGKYRVEKILGKGGMGLVLGARHIRLDEPVAIKVLRPAMMEVDGMVTRFLREARAASKIKSVHVVRVTDVDTLEDGAPYMVMEYLEGTDLSDLRKQKGSLAIVDAVGYVLEACEAIAEAHSLGIVHRDLKPSNLFLQERRDGRKVVKVLDFGISKLDGPGEQDTTKTGQMMGSPRYMSPEQMLSMRDVDPRSDVWSLGAILYEFLTGRPPFVAETTPRICALVLSSDPVLPSSLRSDLPIELEHAVLRCLEKEPGRRFPNVAAFAEAITPFGPTTRDSVPRLSMSHPAPLLPASHGAPPPSGTPIPATWDAETKLESSPRKSTSPRRRIVLVTALIGGVVVLGSLIAIGATRRDSNAVAVGAPPGDTAVAPPAATIVVVPAEPVKRGYSLGDLPDVSASASSAIRPPKPAVTSVANGSKLRPTETGGPIGTGEPGSAVKKPKSGSASDPFDGRRN